MHDNDLGDWIRKSRLQRGWTQAVVAEKIGVPKANGGLVSNWETTTRKPSEMYRKKLEDLFGAMDAEIDFDGEEFGRWLDKEIKNQSTSSTELSEKSGIHQVTIDNIIRGKVANPRSKTMKRLAEALGHSQKKSVGSEVIEETEKNNKIPGLGSFENFSPYDKEEIPDCPGVYVLYDISDRPIYVGKGKKISDRIKRHQDKFWFKEPIVTEGAYIEIGDDDLMGQLEKILIKFLKKNAVVNQQHAER